VTKKRGGSFMLKPASGFEAVREYMLAHPLPVPPTVRECVAQGLSAFGFPPERRSMSPEHTRELIERYPGLYRHADDKPVPTSEPFAREGFACGDGWFTLIERLSLKLAEDPNLVVSQVKEKFGRLVVYFDDSELASPEVEAATDAALDQATEESKRTCELCGNPGTITQHKEWYSARCEPCLWIADIIEACERLTKLVKEVDFATFAASVRLTAEAQLHLYHHVGEGAKRQSPEARKRFPGVDWARLDKFSDDNETGTWGWPQAPTPKEIWKFIHDEAPTLVEKLR
jgi:uncharacterized protein with HEPN domain